LQHDNVMVLLAVLTLEFLAGKTRRTHYILPLATFSFLKSEVFPQNVPLSVRGRHQTAAMFLKTLSHMYFMGCFGILGGSYEAGGRSGRNLLWRGGGGITLKKR
jgi:hypothetical protein